LSPDQTFNIDTDGKLHVLYGGTKVVQHSPPSKTSTGMKGKYRKIRYNQPTVFSDQSAIN